MEQENIYFEKYIFIFHVMQIRCSKYFIIYIYVLFSIIFYLSYYFITDVIAVPVVVPSCGSNSSNANVILDQLLVTAPSWSMVHQDLKWVFLLHTYGFACLFFVLGFYTFFSILNLRYLYMLLIIFESARVYTVSIHIQLFLFFQISHIKSTVYDDN